jgi:hypothetical protein
MSTRRDIAVTAVIEALRPIIERSDHGCAIPITIELTEDHWDALNQAWAELHGDISRRDMRFPEEPIPLEQDRPSPF